MAKGSQLAQLKSALSSAGLSRQSQPGGNKKRKRSSAAARDPALEKAQKAKKLDEINKKLNPFDVKVTKLKHDVGGRRVKGSVGRPAASNQEGLEKRKKLLLPEFERKNRTGGIVDRRFGEKDLTLTPEERMLERFTKEKQRASRGVDFNLEEEDELTHYGQSLSAFDDFDGTGLALDDDEDDLPTPVHKPFGGGEDEDEEMADPDQPERKKSKAEVMAEVMAKSKEHKYLRQVARQEDDQVRHSMDMDFNNIRNLLFGGAVDPSAQGSNAIPLGVRSTGAAAGPSSSTDAPASAYPQPTPSTSAAAAPSLPKPATEDEDADDYDVLVRQLAFDKRAKPTDRTKTEEELAAEEAEKLQKQERQRLRRMRGDTGGGSDGSDDDDDSGRPKKKRRRGVPDADDLDDDFDLDGDAEADMLGPGLEDAISAGEDDEDEDEVSGNEEDEDEGSDSGSEDASGASGSEASDAEAEAIAPSESARKKGKAKATRSKGELPFTFPAPSTHEEFMEIIEDLDPSDIPTVIQRIRTIYHPSLAEDNKLKLQTLCSVLIDHVLYTASPPTSSLSQADALTPHIFALSKQYTIPVAKAFIDKIVLMQKNLVRGLEKGAVVESSKTFPGTAELALLRLVGEIWSTSDMSHAVVTPANMLIAQYLGQGRVRTLSDLASGLFLCSLTHQYHHLSNRFVPEATNFLFAAWLILAPHSLKREDVPGSFPILDFARHAELGVKAKAASKLTIGEAPLSAIINWDQEESVPEQHKIDLLAVTYHLLGQFSELYKGLDAFIELFEPVTEIADRLKVGKLSEDLQKLHNARIDGIRRLLKFAKAERRPLALQSHKPIPIATYAPKFDEGYAYRKRHDPDSERNEAAKLKAEYKKEHKGAMRELRKDNRFLAEEQTRRQIEADTAYKSRMASVHGAIQVERAEEKAAEREKSRIERRAGGKKKK